MNIMEPAVNARIQDMRIVTKTSLSEEESEFDGKSLTKEAKQAEKAVKGLQSMMQHLESKIFSYRLQLEEAEKIQR